MRCETRGDGDNTVEGLTEWADQIDRRLGPISGRDADALARLLRATAERMTQISDDCRNLSGGLLAIHGASDEATVAALKSVAYDIAMNCLSPETAAYQIERRSNPEPAQAGLTAGGGSGSANVSEGVTGGGESAVGDAAGEISGHVELPLVDDPTAPALLPCPFCGGAVRRRDALWPSDGDSDAAIQERE